MYIFNVIYRIKWGKSMIYFLPDQEWFSRFSCNFTTTWMNGHYKDFQIEINLWANGKDNPESSSNLVEMFLRVFSQTLEYTSLYMSDSLYANLKNKKLKTLKFKLGGKPGLEWIGNHYKWSLTQWLWSLLSHCRNVNVWVWDRNTNLSGDVKQYMVCAPRLADRDPQDKYSERAGEDKSKRN